MGRFRIYYGDDSTYSGDPFLAPQTDCQVIAFEADNARGFALTYSKTLSGYYCYRDGQWYCTDDAGFWDYLMILQGPKKVLFGRTIPRTKDFLDILGRAGREGLG